MTEVRVMSEWDSSAPKCPYCGADLFDLAAIPSALKHDGDSDDVECPGCGVTCLVLMAISVEYRVDGEPDGSRDEYEHRNCFKTRRAILMDCSSYADCSGDGWYRCKECARYEGATSAHEDDL